MMPAQIDFSTMTQTDSIYFPKKRTETYKIAPGSIATVKQRIVESPQLGFLDVGFLGQHSIKLDHMGYGSDMTPEFILKHRTAKDQTGESLSMGYFFKKEGAPLNIFLFVMNPWLSRNRGKFYSVNAYVRSPQPGFLPNAVQHLDGILRANSI